jgi:hypothetical protein
MKKIFGVFITIVIFILNFMNLGFANKANVSKPPRHIKNKASNRVNLQTGKPVPAHNAGKVYPKYEQNNSGKVYPKVETEHKFDAFPKVENGYKLDVFPKVEME